MGVFNTPHLPNADNTNETTFVKLISDRDREIYQTVNFYVINCAISLFGIATNVMNIVVFYRQGFTTTINISFFALAISDLCSEITMVWYTTALNGLLVKAGARIHPHDVAYLTGGAPHICFARISSWITVFITAERSMCIMFPLNIKQIITPGRTTVIICVIYILIILSFEPEYATAYIGWKWEVNSNQTLLGLIYTCDRNKSEGMMFILYSILGFAAFIAAIIFTLILVIQLNKQSTWRQNQTIKNTGTESISTRERKIMKMAVIIATVLIVCYTPGVAVSLISFFETEFGIRGRYINAFVSTWSFVVIFNSLNSGVNIFFYYYMSTKYRETFDLVFGCRQCKVAAC